MAESFRFVAAPLHQQARRGPRAGYSRNAVAPAARRQSVRRVNRLTVVAGKSGVMPGFGYGAEKYEWRGVMTDNFATTRRPVDNAPGETSMSRLADRIAAMAPPPLDLPPTSIMRPSPAVAAALATSAKISARAAERARRSRSVVGLMVDSFVSACSFIP
jgi:hypothetical protein